MSTINEIHLKCDCKHDSILEGSIQPVLYSFVLDQAPGYKVISQPETLPYKKLNEIILNTVTFYLEDENHEEATFNGETLTSTLQMITTWTIK